MTFSIKDVKVKEGKIAIVTGANNGLGFETTKVLAEKGVTVIMACRNLSLALEAKEAILADFPHAKLEVMKLDLSSLTSVREFANSVIEKYDQLDLLIENAGIMYPEYTKTEDGFESQMGVNYFANFLLTKLLFPLLNKKEGSRIVTLSSIAHKQGKIDFENINSEKHYSKMAAYSQSKLACLMFALELNRRIKQSGSKVLAVSAHPGVSDTNLFKNIPKAGIILMSLFKKLITHKPKNAAKPILWAALGEDVAGGDYFGPVGFNEMKGEVGKAKFAPQALDETVANKLWIISEELTDEKFTM